MKKLFTLLTTIALGSMSFGQTVFQSDLSTWGGGNPTDWMGTKTNIPNGDVTEVGSGATYGSSMAQLVNQTSSHVRFTTLAVTVVPGETYEIKMWVNAVAGELRTSFFDLVDNTTGPFSNGYGAYNGYIDLSTASAGSLVEISQIVTVPGGTSNSVEFILSLRNTDAAGILVDSIAVNQTAPPPPLPITPIYDIQYTTATNGDSPLLGDVVKTQGVVTGIYLFGTNQYRFFIQNGDGAWNGIYVYDNTNTSLAIGDSVTVTGEVQEFNSLTELGYISEIVVLNSGNTLPTAAVVTNTTVVDEEWEGVLVELKAAVCTVGNDSFGAWMANDGSASNVKIDDDLLPTTFTAVLGDGYDITGIRHYSFSENLIYPTTTAHIVTVGFAGLNENNSEFSIYPNPATDVVTITAEASSIVAIYAIDGSVVYQGQASNNIDVSNLDAGIYQVVVTNNTNQTTQKLIVR